MKGDKIMALYRLAENGTSTFHIVTHRYADETVRYAASELQKYILKATCTDIPYFSDRCPMRGPEIRIGSHVRDMVDSVLPTEGFRIREDGTHIYIEGGSSRGVLYGVYHFLSRHCGFRCFTKDAETIEKADILDVEIGDERDAPTFEYREAYFRHAFDGDFCAKNSLNSNMGDISKAKGGRMKWFNFHHSFRDLVPAEEYFDTHPEYFSEIDGKRVPDKQICLTNPDVLEIAEKKLLEWIRQNPECTVFSVAQNDGYGPCTCPSCRALVEKEGSESGPIIHFVNALADSIREEHPRILLHTFAYVYSLPAPRYAVARDNVIVRLCNFSCRFDKPIMELAIENPTGKDAEFLNALEEWKSHAKRLYVWDYAVNFSNYLQPFFHFHVMADNIRMFRDHGVLGVLEQGNFAYGGGAAMDDLKSYLIAQLLWNPDVDVDEEIHRFMVGVYGEKAGSYVEQYVRMVEEAETKSPLSIYQSPNAPYLTDKLIAAADELFRYALSAAGSDTYRTRVAREYLSVRFVQLARLPMDAPYRTEKIKNFMKDLKKHGITEIFERTSLAAAEYALLTSTYTSDRSKVYSLYYTMQ